MKVAGHWEIGHIAPIMEAYQWAYPLRDFEVMDWLMCPVSGIQNPDHEVKLFEFPDYESMLGSCEDLQRVIFEPRTKENPNSIWLHDFQHPENCVYVFGSAHYNPIRHKRAGDVIVTIKTERDNGVLWSAQCMPIVLYDRMVKAWR